METLLPEIIRIILRLCDPRDAHYLVQTCKRIRHCATEADLHRYRCGVVRYKELCERHYWSKYPWRWNNRKECPHCAAILHSQERYDGHVALCKMRDNRQCEWCNLRIESQIHEQCPLRPDVTCGKSVNGFTPCRFRGVRAQVEHHKKRCKIKCQACGQRCSMRQAKDHTTFGRHIANNLRFVQCLSGVGEQTAEQS